MAKRSERFPARFLKAADLDGEDLTVTIDRLEEEELGKDKTLKSVLYFRGGKVKPLPLNGTNWDAIAKVTGKDDDDDWEGEKISLYVDEVPFGREMVDAIRVRLPKVSRSKAKTEPPRDDTIPF